MVTAPEQNTAQGEAKPEPADMTYDQLMAAIKEASGKNDWKLVSKLAGQINKLEAAKAKADTEAKNKALEGMTQLVKDTIGKALAGLKSSGKLDAADGIWYADDFGEKETSCRLMKSAPRKASGGGGGGKKFDITTEALLAKHGTKSVEGKTPAITYSKWFEESTDGNHRYKVRTKLLKLDGLL